MPSSSLQFALPSRLSKVVIQKSKAPDAKFEENHKKGWDAGYKAGMWQAELEAKKKTEEQAKASAEWIQKLESLHEQFLKEVSSHLPQLLLAAFSRVMQHHKFTDEEILKEVQTLVQELSLAKSLSIECSTADAEMLKKNLDDASLSLTQAQIQWTPNPEFQSGEYVIQSDLGVLDGRRSTRTAHVHAAMKSFL